MKKMLLLSTLFFTAFSASAECRITSVRDDKESAAFQKHGGWNFKAYDKVCAKLERARARVQITGHAIVLSNRSIGWVSLSVVDLDSGVGTSDFSSVSTQVSEHAGQDRADELMVAALNVAANDW